MGFGNNASSSSLVITAAGAVAATVLTMRAIKRYWSPTIECQLKCQCGKIEGTISAKKEDSIRIVCYCEDCRQYAKFIAGLGNHPDTTIGQPHGDSRVVQVCKSAVTITKGQELLGLARKGPPNPDNKKIFMHRFYAKCCHVPLMNTVDFLGFVGVFTDFLDANQKSFAGPVAMLTEEALVDPGKREADIFVPDFLWKLVRYAPWTKAGPFDYELEPVYWGGAKDGAVKEQ